MVKLVVISEEMNGKEFELTGDRITVGRLPDNQIHIDHSAVSSHHAEMTLKGDDFLVRDLNSTNGTRVNGQRIIEKRLCHGDTIGFAHVQMQYISTSKAAPQPLPALNKKTVDLTASRIEGANRRPEIFHSSAPFSVKKKSSKFKVLLQLLALLLGFVGIIALFFAIVKIFSS